jgi:transposase-like protein
VKSFSDDERKQGKRWRYAHFAVDAITGDLLHVEVYDTSDSCSVRAFLAALRAKGIRPKVAVTDMLGAYSNAIIDTFGPGVKHHFCLFHHLQAVRQRLREKCGADWKEQPLLRRLVALVDDIYDCRDRRTARKRLAKVLALRQELEAKHPEAVPVLDTIDNRFPKVANTLGHPDLPMTNNATERVIKAFNRHYKNMAGLESVETARVQLRLFRFFYRLTPWREPARAEDRGKCPLERAGWSLRGIPLADYVRRFTEAWDEEGPELFAASETPVGGENPTSNGVEPLPAAA